MKWSMMVALMMAATVMAGCTGNTDGDGSGASCPDAEALDGRSCVVFDTSEGSFVVELYDEEAPITVTNFLRYVQDGFYNGTLFHRIVADFVIQGGGMDTNGDFKQTREPIPNEASQSGLKNEVWTLSMARGPAADSATSQFFINTVNNSGLDPGGFSPDGYAVFGIVTEGRDVVQAIEQTPTTTYQPGRHCQDGGQERSCPVEDVVVRHVTIGHKGAAFPLQEAPAEDARETPEDPEAPETPELATGGPDIVLGVITPGQWHVNGDPDHIMLWAHNTGGEVDALEWDITLADGAPLPEGWNLTFSRAVSDLAPGNARQGDGRAVVYADWVHTVATLRVPADTRGEFPAVVHLGNWSEPVLITVSEPVRIAQPGDGVLVHTVGTLERNGEGFYSGDFPTQAGTGGAVIGFRDGLLGLAEGERVSLVVPPPFAYGYTPYSEHALADETLVFTIDHEFTD